MHARQLVHRTLAEMGIVDPGLCNESVLIDGGYCVGRRFSFESVGAVWMEADAKIDFYDADGKLLKTISSEEQVELKKAA
jgi:hypothetical protein